MELLLLEIPLLPCQLRVAVEYTHCFSDEGYNPLHHECPRYDTKQSDGEVPVMLDLWGVQRGNIWEGSIYGSNRIKSRFLEFTKLRIYAKLNCLK